MQEVRPAAPVNFVRITGLLHLYGIFQSCPEPRDLLFTLGCRTHTFCMASGASRLLDDPDIDRTAVDLLYNPIVIDTFAHICNLDIAKPRQKYVLFGNYVTINKVYYGNNRLCLTICN